MIRGINKGVDSIEENEVIFGFPKDIDLKIDNPKLASDMGHAASFSHDNINYYAVEIDKLQNFDELIDLLNDTVGCRYLLSQYGSSWHFARLCDYATIHALPLEFGWKFIDDAQYEISDYLKNSKLKDVFKSKNPLDGHGTVWMILEGFFPKYSFAMISPNHDVKGYLHQGGKMAGAIELIKKGTKSDFNLNRYAVQMVISFYDIYFDMKREKIEDQPVCLTDAWEVRKIHSVTTRS